MKHLKRDLCICEAKLSGANEVLLPMLRQQMDDADAIAAQAKADCLEASNALESAAQEHAALETHCAALETELQESQEEGCEVWRRLHYAVECHEKQRIACVKLHEIATAIAAERDEALDDLDAALDNLDAAEERYSELKAMADYTLQTRHTATLLLDKMYLENCGRLADKLAACRAELAVLRAAGCQANATCSVSVDTPTASSSQQVQSATAIKSTSASRGKAPLAADPLQLATPPQLTRRQRSTAGARSESE